MGGFQSDRFNFARRGIRNMSRSTTKESNFWRHPGRNLLAALLIVGVAWSMAYSYTQEKPGSPSDDQVKERLGFIENALRAGQPRARAWWYGWIAGYSAGAIVSGSLAAAHWNDKKLDSATQLKVKDRGFAEDMLVTSTTLALGVGGLLIDPFVPAFAPARLRALPDGTAEERQLKLDRAEALLRECARREREGRGWLTHLLNLGVNAAAGLVTVWAFDRPWSDGLLTFAAGEAISLVNIYSQPRRAIADLNSYEVRYLGKQGAFLRSPGDRAFSFGMYPGGFGFRVRF
jgi:hypothetical protein